MTQDTKLPVVGEQQSSSAATPADNNERSYVESMQFLVEDTRTHVVGELYDTERSYVESLQFLIEKYMKPLKGLDSNRTLIDSNLVHEIFYTIPEILQHHENFLSALQDRLSSDWDTSQVIGNVFIEAFTNQQIIDTYTAFINNWKNARQAIKLATQSKPAFEKFLEAMSREHRNKLTLDALLIMPVQRIPRYELLIKELIKHTPEDHPDYGPLMVAQKEIHELALKIDQAEREMIHQEQLKDLESLIDGHIELQSPQRDFIRYDLVTIISASALTVAKKERVLFLFCDLLIMASVKKKASRRSNLQTAFANSSNDLSLLEGNKFKLLFKVHLDQVEIRLANDEIQLQQQHEHHLQMQHESRLMQEKRKEIESDLGILQQIESLILKVHSANKGKINESIDELSNQLRGRLSNLDQVDLQAFGSQQQQANSQSEKDLHTNLSSTTAASADSKTPSSLSSTTATTQSYSNNINLQPSAIQSNQSHHSNSTFLQTSVTNNPSTNSAAGTGGQQETSTSLEFIISNTSLPLKDTSPMNFGISSAINESNEGNAEGQQQNNCERLVVTFTSVERRQAFLMAFIEAKNQRSQLQQRQKIYSTSVTLKLSQPNSPDRRNDQRRTKLHHQDNITNSRLTSFNRASSQCNSNAARILSSAPLGQHAACGATIIHQMSAPQSLTDTSISPTEIRSSSQCNSCSSSVVPGSNQCYQFNSRHKCSQHHHHHQLMHQPASQPASLDTICCHEAHNDESNSLKLSSIPHLGQLDESVSLERKSDVEVHHYQEDYYKYMNKYILSNVEGASAHQSLEQNSLKFRPKFIVTIPMNFLNTQHPSLQFTCSTMRNDQAKEQKLLTPAIPSLNEQKHQTVKDSSGQLWFCMSNGYVSHVALISLRRQKSGAFGETYSAVGREQAYDIVPVIRSAGDICKAHINCAVQVKRKSNITVAPIGDVLNHCNDGKTTTDLSDSKCIDPNDQLSKPVPDLSIKSSSPPVNIRPKSSILADNKDKDLRLSESAPSDSPTLKGSQINYTTSFSTTKLEVPMTASAKAIRTNSKLNLEASQLNKFNEERKFLRSTHDAICHRHYHHNNKRFLNQPSAINSAHSPDQHNQSNLSDKYHHQHHHHGHTNHHHHHHHQHSHHHGHHIHGNHADHSHNLYGSRHHTVPIAELRKALDRQGKKSDHCPADCKNHHLAAPSNTPVDSMLASKIGKEQQADLSVDQQTVDHQLDKKDRSATPPTNYSGKSFRSARLLRHQASLKTSSILAKLVMGAGKRSYLRKSNPDNKLQSDDNDTDNEGSQQPQDSSSLRRQEADNNLFDNNMLALTKSGIDKNLLNTGESNNQIISPLSSVSSLNSSTNSSMTVNSVCASSPNRSSCELLVHSFSASCCAGPATMRQTRMPTMHCAEILPDRKASDECGIRSRSATMPSQTILQQLNNQRYRCSIINSCELSSDKRYSQESYKLCEIVGDSCLNEDENKRIEMSEENSSLWLGCDDGSLIVIDCLTKLSDNSDCQVCDLNERNINCSNTHSEVKLDAAICDISNYKDETVFVSLANGQLVIFSRNCDSNEDNTCRDWSLTKPKLLTVTTNELNSTSKLCLIDDQYLWYSYGRNIFVLNVLTLKIETTIMAPTNDLSLQFTVQSITIDNMELMGDATGVWISFKNSYLIQLYDVKNYKLLVEVNLLEPIDKMLAYGNEIIRQHKTSCLKATSLLNVNNPKDQCNTLFIGTSAGIVLYLDITQEQLQAKCAAMDGAAVEQELNPQVASLKHGHSGHVKFLHLVEIEQKPEICELSTVDDNNNTTNNVDESLTSKNDAIKSEKETFLISGGIGVDLYGPNDEMQHSLPHLSGNEDNLNHLLLWQL